MWCWLALALASGRSDADDVPRVPLGGPEACDAQERLTEALADGRLAPTEAHSVLACDHTSLYTVTAMDTFQALYTSLEAQVDDPEAVAAHSLAATTIRGGILGDGIRAGLHEQAIRRLETAPPGPWQSLLAVAAAAEPGPQPAADPVAIRSYIERMQGPGPWGLPLPTSLFKIQLIAWIADISSPFYDRAARDAQAALESDAPLQALEDGRLACWTPACHGLFLATRDIAVDHADHQDRWRALLP